MDDEQQPTGEVLTGRQVLDRLKISQITLDRWEKSGRLPALRLPNGYRRWRSEDVNALLDERRYG